MSDDFPEPGQVFEDKYHLESVIGKGGFARIYEAEQLDLNRTVALKILERDARKGSDSGTAIERFQREAQLIAGLRDSHTITLHDHGQTDDGFWYLVFEHVDGKSLREIRLESGPIAPNRVVKILKQALMSLEEAHAQGVLHRDIKPANIMIYEHLGRTDQVKVLDFGIAKSVLKDEQDDIDRDLTETGKVIGTPRYMAPEQLRDGTARPASDLYSLGLVAYELLTGDRAVQASGIADIIAEQVTGSSIQLPEWLDVTDELGAVIDRMLEQEVEDRYQEASEVLEALEDLDEDELSDVPAPTAETEIISVPSEDSAEAPETEPASSDRNRKLYVWAAGATAVAVFAVGGYLVGFVFLDDNSSIEAADSEIRAPEHRRMTVETEPSGASVRVEDRSVGTSPVEIPTREIDFPVLVTARTEDGQTSSSLLSKPQETVKLRLTPSDTEKATGPEVSDESEDAASGATADESSPHQERETSPSAAEASGSDSRPEPGSEPASGEPSSPGSGDPAPAAGEQTEEPAESPSPEPRDPSPSTASTTSSGSDDPTGSDSQDQPVESAAATDDSSGSTSTGNESDDSASSSDEEESDEGGEFIDVTELEGN